MITKQILLLLLFLPLSRNPASSGIREAAPFDVVINELMVRPSPPVGLPEAEYIELFNRSEHPVNLQNWTVSVGTRSRVLPQHILLPGSYYLITHEKHAVELSEFGDVAGLPTFPVLAMGGQTVVLRDDKGRVISAVSYSDKWYGSSLKASGGWSIEQIDPFNPCGGANNWRASASSTGGTPGATNSVRDNNPDKSRPGLVRATSHHNGSIRLHFSEPMHPRSGWSPSDYFAEGPGKPLSVIPSDPFFREVDLFFLHNFQENTDYKISVTGNLYDCAGNFLSTDRAEARFTVPATPHQDDIRINEILFNPYPGGVNFVELVNISDKTFDLKQLILAGMAGGEPDPAYIIAPDGYLLFPGEYVVLTTDPETIRSHYYTPNPHSFVIMDRMPQMNNESGRVAITGLGLNVLDDFEYMATMHSPLLTDRKGISLERIHYSRPTSDPSNWLSASENSGFATPGYKNSQFSELTARPQNILNIDPKIFSPDNSGYNDVVNIGYELDKPGYTGNITVFDSRGRLIRRVARNELFGTSGVYSWDGRNDANNQSRLGVYLILMELFHPDGEVRKYKEAVVLGGRFR